MMRHLMVVLLAGLLLTGCSKPSLVGKWNAEIAGAEGLSTFEMTEYGDIKASGVIDLKVQKLPVTVTGTYTRDGEDKLLVTPQKATTTADISQQLVDMAFESYVGTKTRTLSLEFVDPNTIRVAPAPGEEDALFQAVTLKRVKE